MTLRDRLKQLRTWAGRDILSLFCIAIVILAVGVSSGCGSYLKNTAGQTSQGVHVKPIEELEFPPDVAALDLIYSLVLDEYSATHEVPLEKLYSYMDPDNYFGVHSWIVRLQESWAGCPDSAPRCAGYAEVPSFMTIVWLNYRWVDGGLVREERLCPARTAAGHELTHLLLWYDKGTTDPDHELCWEVEARARLRAQIALCPWTQNPTALQQFQKPTEEERLPWPMPLWVR